MHTVQELIAACQWDTARFLIFSANVFAPFIYYSHVAPLLLSLCIGIFIFANNPKALINRILLGITLLFSVWSYFDLILWATDKPHFTMFFWSMQILIEPMIYAGMLYFIYVYIYGKDTSLKSKIVAGVLFLPTILLTPTRFALLGFDLANCNREALEGPLVHYYGYFIAVVLTLCIVVLGIKSHRNAKDATKKRQVLLVIVGALLFLLFFSSGNILGSFTDDWRVPQWGLLGMPIFIAFLAYLIVKFRAFNIKLIGAQALVFALLALVASILLLRRIENVRVITAVTLPIVGALGFLLIRGVKREVQQRERLEVLTRELDAANAGLAQTNEKLEGMNVKLAKMDELKSEFVSMAGHQLRGPMTVIKGYISLVLDGTIKGVNAGIKDALKRAMFSTEQLVKLVSSLLDLSRIESGKIKYDMAEGDIAKIAAEVIDKFGEIVKKKGIALTREDHTDGKARFVFDQDKIREAMVNLVDNAIKYSSEGGRVAVALDMAGSSTDTRARVSVRDHGLGIKPEDIGKLFDKFSRTEEAKRHDPNGLGIGLYFAKRVVQDHGGKVGVESEGIGRGSTFWLELPMRREAM